MDPRLIERYAETGDEAAFRAVVGSSLPLVYGVALRTLGGDAHGAADVAQQVYVDLARQAGRLKGHPALLGWLYRSAYYTATKARRAGQRRAWREAAAGTAEVCSCEASLGQEGHPLLDEALASLGEADRAALFWRFCEEQSWREIGQRLGVPENTARMRIERALAKLEAWLRKRGVSSSAALLGASVAGLSHLTVPVAVAGQIMTAVAGLLVGGLVVWGAATWAWAVSGAVALGGLGVGWREWRTAEHAWQEEQRAWTESSARPEPLAAPSRQGAHAETRVSLATPLAPVGARTEEAVAPPDTAGAGREGGRPSQGEIYDLRALDEPPKPLASTPPRFPGALKAAGVGGTVKLAVVVDEAGQVQSVEVLQADHPELAAAAREAVGLWVFSPGLRQGQAVRVRLVLPLRFEVSKDVRSGLPEQAWF